MLGNLSLTLHGMSLEIQYCSGNRPISMERNHILISMERNHRILHKCLLCAFLMVFEEELLETDALMSTMTNEIYQYMITCHVSFSAMS